MGLEPDYTFNFAVAEQADGQWQAITPEQVRVDYSSPAARADAGRRLAAISTPCVDGGTSAAATHGVALLPQSAVERRLNTLWRGPARTNRRTPRSGCSAPAGTRGACLPRSPRPPGRPAAAGRRPTAAAAPRTRSSSCVGPAHGCPGGWS
ncbi:hypothetical protein G6F22_018523 [Rhizopus arrhizus]|nr:hypothetical protein G6F22_018523 [Rhizopus arrhizus]